MPIIRRRTKTPDVLVKLIFRIPNDMMEYINLHALSTGTSRATIARIVLQNWKLEKEKSGHSVEELYERIIFRIEKQWISKQKTMYETFDDFIAELERELIRRKTNTFLIRNIIRKLYEKRIESREADQ